MLFYRSTSGAPAPSDKHHLLPAGTGCEALSATPDFLPQHQCRCNDDGSICEQPEAPSPLVVIQGAAHVQLLLVAPHRALIAAFGLRRCLAHLGESLHFLLKTILLVSSGEVGLDLVISYSLRLRGSRHMRVGALPWVG